MGREHFLLQGSEQESDEDILTAFLQQYYHRAAFIPREILLPMELPSAERGLLEDWLSEKKKVRVQLLCPQRGTKHDIVAMAEGNAAKYLSDEAARIQQADERTHGAVAELGRYLGLDKPPERMECFDISHIQGSETVASMVVFEGGLPKNPITGALRFAARKGNRMIFFRCGK